MRCCPEIPCPSQLAARYSYDDTANGNWGIGQRTGVVDASGTTSWRYDGRGRVTREVKQVTGAGSFTTEWGYNSMDLPTTMTYPNGEVVTTHYRPHGALLSVVGSDTYLSGAAYDAAGRLVSQQLANGSQKLTQGYFPWTTPNGVGRLQSIQAGTNGSPASFLALSYKYYTSGNISQIVEATNGGQAQSFNYDALNRLTSATATNPLGGGVGQYNESYSYHATTGNLAVKAGQNLSYTNAAHPHAATSMGTSSYGYDANGNMTSRTVGGVSYALSYDHESRLTSVVGGSTSEQYSYDGDGARVKVVSGYVTTVYIGNHYEYTVDSTPPPTPTPIPSPTLSPTPVGIPTMDPTSGGAMAPSGGSGTTPVRHTTRSYYYAGAQRLAVRDSATGVAYLYGDHLGSASVAVSASGSVLSRTRYKPWGEQRGQSGEAFP